CVHYKGPHHFYEYPERHAKLLEGVTIPEPPTLHEDVEQTSPRLKAVLPQQMNRNKSYYDRHKNETEPRMTRADDSRGQASAAYQHMLHKYIRCVAAIDDNLQRLFDYLDSEHITDDTLIVYTSDQGYWLGQHGLYDKRLILDESLKMPLIVRYPKLVKPGTVNRDLCSNVDFAPTLLEFAGVDIPAAMQGRSLWPLLRGETPTDWRQAVWYAYWGAPPNHWGIRTADATLVRFPGTDEFEFYDLKIDPLQKRSAHADPAYAERIARLNEVLTSTMREVEIQPSELPGTAKQGRATTKPRTKSRQKVSVK
ncbi:MAG: sulfatase-like hydrolase/transferase, partial [Planctomycetales bacterium]|nr:sulfatase-like hydrolase/transferase [Planctomycetales bacterium]